jgi:cysteine synthase A
LRGSAGRARPLEHVSSVLASIGNTPLVRLNALPPRDAAEVWVKLEGTNPTGSMKDRMALSMVEGAERRGQLKPGVRVVEYTGGSTGGSLALVCAAKGFRAHLVCSDAFAAEKRRTMEAFGATVELVPSEGGRITPALIQEMVARARELSTQDGTFWTDQFNNPDNRAGYHGMGREILEQTGGSIDAFVMAAGTGGCFSGNAEVLKAAKRDIRCVAVEPAESAALSGGPVGGHRIEGIGPGFVPAILRRDLIDEIVPVPSTTAYEMARTLARREGLLAGISSGANVFVALEIARRLGPGRKVVTVAADSGLKYLAGDLFQ